MAKANRSNLKVEGAQSTIRSPARVAWRQFRRNRVAMAGAAFILLVVILAVVAPWVTTYHYATQNTAIARA